MYHLETSRPKQLRRAVQTHRDSTFSQTPISSKKLKDCTKEEISRYQPLLWSSEKFNTFLHFFRDREIGDPAYSETIMDLIQEFDSPQVIHGFEETANFHGASGLPHAFLSAPMTVENTIFRGDDLFHLQLGFRSIAVLERIPESNQYRIIKILKFNSPHFCDETEMALARYETSLSHHFHEAADRKDMSEAQTTMGHLMAFEQRKSSMSIASIVTAQVSSCTFAAMTDRAERYAVVMHLDADTPANADNIRDILLEAGVSDVRLENLFISRIKGKKTAAKEKEIFETLGMRKDGIPILHQTRLDRGNYDNFLAMQHQMIGVDFSHGKATIHGSQGELMPPSTTPSAAIQTGAQKALMFLAKNIFNDSYDSFCSLPFIYPFSVEMSEIIQHRINRELYEKVKTKDPVAIYRLLLMNLPEILELLSIYNTSYFSMELASENPV